MGKFGTKVGSIERMKRKLDAASGNVTFIKSIPADVAYSVRFLTDPEEWVSYAEAWDADRQRSYPLPESDDPESVDRVSHRYLANVVEIESDRVVPLRIPSSLANRLMTRYERYGTLTDRDYDLFRSGKGLNTEYDVETGDKANRRIAKYELLDLETVLEDAYNAAFDVEVPESPNPLRGRSEAAAADDEDVDSESEFYTEAELVKMSMGELRAVARDYGIEFNESTTKDDFIEMILEESEES